MIDDLNNTHPELVDRCETLTADRGYDDIHNTELINDVEGYYEDFKKDKKTSLLDKGMSITEKKN